MSYPLQNILLRHSDCVVKYEYDEASAINIEEIIRHHLSIRLQTILAEINASQQYKFVIGGGRAAEMYINPILQNVLYRKDLYRFTHEFDLVVYRNTFHDTNVWQPWGWRGQNEDEWNRLNHPAVNKLVEEIRIAYQSAFARRELISHIQNCDRQNNYNLVLLATELENGDTFGVYSSMPNGYLRIWQIKFAIPTYQKKKDGSIVYEFFDYVDIKNGIEAQYLYQVNGEVFENMQGQVAFRRGAAPDHWFPNEFFWKKQGRWTWDYVSIPIRPGSTCYVVDPFILYKDQLRLVGSKLEREEILTKDNYDDAAGSLQSLGLYLTDGGAIDSAQRETLISNAYTYKKRMVRLFCLFTMLAQLQRLNIDSGVYESLLSRSPDTMEVMTMSLANYFQFFTMIPFQGYRWRFKTVSKRENIQLFTENYAPFSDVPDQQYRFLKMAFQNNLLCWYRYNGGDEMLTTVSAIATDEMRRYNNQLSQNQQYCTNENALSIYSHKNAKDNRTYQQTIDAWITPNNAIRLRFHDTIYTLLQISGYNRSLFWKLTESTDRLNKNWKRFLYNTYIYSYFNDSPFLNKDLKLKTYRFGYPMNVLFKPSIGGNTYLALVDSLPVGQIVYTAAYLSTTMKTNGHLNLPTFHNVLETGHTFYEFELQGDGFLYFTYVSAESAALANEHEVFIPIWTRFSIKKKQWRYIADINTAGGDSLQNYKLVYVITLQQESETSEEYSNDIVYKGPVSFSPVPAKVHLAPSSQKAQIGPPALPVGPLPPGYNFQNAAADTGIPFHTPFSAALQADIANWNDIDNWVSTHFPANDPTFASQENIYEYFKTIDPSTKDGSLYPYSKIPYINDILPDGSCLVHSLLYCVSSAYRLHPNKSQVGIAFRQHQMVKFATTYQDLRNLMDRTYWLGDREIGKFQQKYHINIILHTLLGGYFSTDFSFTFQDAPYVEANLKYPGQPTFILLNRDNAHYESCHYVVGTMFLNPALTVAIVSRFYRNAILADGVMGPDPHVYPISRPEHEICPSLPNPSFGESFKKDWISKYTYLFQSDVEISIKRAPNLEEGKITTGIISTYRTNLNTSLGGNFPIGYQNQIIDALFCFACNNTNLLREKLRSYLPHLNIMVDDPLEQIYLNEITRIIEAFPEWTTQENQTLNIFVSIFQRCSEYFTLLARFSTEKFPLIDTRDRLLRNEGFGPLVSSEAFIVHYLIMELIQAISNALSYDKSVPQLILPNTSDEFNYFFDNKPLGPKPLSQGIGYSFPPFDPSKINDQESTRNSWEDIIVTILCCKALLDNNVSKFFGGKRWKRTRRATHADRKTRKRRLAP